MQAIQFTTIAHDGMIPIPAEYRAQTEGEVQVIVLLKENKVTMRKSRFLESVRRHKFRLPADYRFERDSLHER